MGPDTENIYTDDFFEKLDGVANALDNVDASELLVLKIFLNKIVCKEPKNLDDLIFMHQQYMKNKYQNAHKHVIKTVHNGIFFIAQDCTWTGDVCITTSPCWNQGPWAPRATYRWSFPN